LALGAAVAAAAAGAEDAFAAGSGVMMLTGGIEAEDGNSALVGRPVGIDAASPVGTGAAPGTIGVAAAESRTGTAAPLHAGA